MHSSGKATSTATFWCLGIKESRTVFQVHIINLQLLYMRIYDVFYIFYFQVRSNTVEKNRDSKG